LSLSLSLSLNNGVKSFCWFLTAPGLDCPLRVTSQGSILQVGRSAPIPVAEMSESEHMEQFLDITIASKHFSGDKEKDAEGSDAPQEHKEADDHATEGSERRPSSQKEPASSCGAWLSLPMSVSNNAEDASSPATRMPGKGDVKNELQGNMPHAGVDSSDLSNMATERTRTCTTPDKSDDENSSCKSWMGRPTSFQVLISI
jgi:hypothetical protein